MAVLVLVSGGLGPTDDDVTRASVAELCGRPLHRDEAFLDELRERFLRRGYGELPPTNHRQADVPEGARMLHNPHGTAPGLVLEHEGVVLVMLPGVPRELRGIVEGDFAELLDEHFGDRLVPVHHRTLHTTGVPESRLAQLLEEARHTDAAFAEAVEAVTMAYLPDLKGVDLRLTARAGSVEEATAALDAAEAAVDRVAGRWRFRAATGDVVEALLRALREAELTMAVAESCTAGLVAKRVTDHAGSSDVFLGGVVAYHDSVKETVLGVPSEDLRSHGAVSETVACRMALRVAERLGADVSVAVTGIAGPGGGTEEKPVGMVWLAVAVDGQTRARRVDFVGDRAAVRERSAQAALTMLLRAVERRGGNTRSGDARDA